MPIFRVSFCAIGLLLFSVDAISSEPADVDEVQVALLRNHPACIDVFGREEINRGENELACSQLEFAAADKELNVTYKSVRAGLSAGRQAVLKSEQVVWIRNKESDCQDAPDRALAMGPRFREAATNFCLAEITRKRTEYLKHFR